MTPTRKGVGALDISHVFSDSIVFKRDLLLIFVDLGHKIGHFLWTM